MSPRSRHAPLPAASNNYKGPRTSVPRHQALPQSSMSFSSATLDPDMLNIENNYFLSSSTSRSRHYDPSWTASSGSGPAVDDFLAVSGYDSLSQSGSYPISMMQNTDAMDVTYGLTSGGSLSRHAPSDTMNQVSGLTPPMDMDMDNYASFMDFDPESSLMDGSYLPNFGPARLSTPPPEEFIQTIFDEEYPSRHRRNTHTMYGPTFCEDLGESKLQSYSATRHSAALPRLIRPSSDRSDTSSSRSDSSDSPSQEDSLDRVKARNDPRYDAKPDKDGYYRCPYNNNPDKCNNHKATKQKCIYSKYLDSHLRPYKCKFATTNPDCEDARFSSNACLFRHERETHGLHNHGHNPYVCLFADCERAKDGNGFPRRWNQRDHMKRMHGWEADDNASDRHAEGAKRRRGAPSSVPMRRSGSSSYARAQQAAVAYPKDHRRPSAVSTSRHAPKGSYCVPLQACNMVAYPSMESLQYSQSQYLAQPRHGQQYMPTTYSYQTSVY